MPFMLTLRLKHNNAWNQTFQTDSLVYLHNDWSLEQRSKSTYLWQVTNFQVKTDDERVPANPDHKPHSILKTYTYAHMQKHIKEHIRDM